MKPEFATPSLMSVIPALPSHRADHHYQRGSLFSAGAQKRKSDQLGYQDR